MWSQTWSNIVDFAAPYPGKASVDVTDEMVKQVNDWPLLYYLKINMLL